MFGCVTMLEPRNMLFTIAPDTQLQPYGQSVDNRNPNAVQTARNLVRIAVKLTTRMQLSHNHLSGRHTFFFMNSNRNTATIIRDGNRAISIDPHQNMIRMTSQRLIDAIVYNLVNHMVQTGAVISVTDIHSWPFANSL